MAKQNSVNLDITNNADGFSIAGGSTSRTLGVSGADITLVGSGTATLTFPTTSTTVAGLGITQTFTASQTFSSGITSSSLVVSGGSTLSNVIVSSTTNAVDVIASTDGVGLRIAQATSGAGSRFGALRLGRSATTTHNTYIESSTGTLTLYNGIDAFGTNMLSISTSALTIPTTIAGATFSGIIRSTSGISASTAITGGSYVYSESGYRVGSSSINAQTGTTYSLLTSDDGKIITMNNASGITLTVPAGLPIGFNCTVIQLGTGSVLISGTGGVTLNSYQSKFRTIGQHGAASIMSYTTNVFNVAGGLT
jgi:hypothetical protein